MEPFSSAEDNAFPRQVLTEITLLPITLHAVGVLLKPACVLNQSLPREHLPISPELLLR